MPLLDRIKGLFGGSGPHRDQLGGDDDSMSASDFAGASFAGRTGGRRGGTPDDDQGADHPHSGDDEFSSPDRSD